MKDELPPLPRCTGPWATGDDLRRLAAALAARCEYKRSVAGAKVVSIAAFKDRVSRFDRAALAE